MVPKIGIISFVPPASDHKNFTTPVDYIYSILDAGGMPIGIPVSEDISRCEAYVEMIDGLLVPGGEDVSPRLYGEDPIPQVTSASIEKDLFEYELIRLTVKAGKPVFGICRGHQIINTALGGTLVQDIPSQLHANVCHTQSRDQRDELTHSITCAPGSIIYDILGEKCWTNTFHHQAVKELAPGLIATAWSSDGVIEALESEDKRIWAVQFHPENLCKRYPEFKGLFRRLVAMAADQNK